MTVQDLGSIGELIAAIATVATLAYLAVQIRQSTKVARANSHHAVFETYASLLASMRNDPEFVAILRRSFTDWEGLSKNERALVHLHMSTHLLHCQNAFALVNQGVLDPELYRAYEDLNVSALRCPGLATWYAIQEKYMPPSFVERIRSRLADPATLPPPMHEVYTFYAPD